MRTLSIIFSLSVAILGCAGVESPDMSVPAYDAIASTDSSNPHEVQTLLLRLQAEGAIVQADVNADGVVDIQDLVIVAQNFGQQVDKPVKEVEISGLNAKIIEEGETFWTFSWQLTFHNNTRDAIEVRADIRFLDSDNFELDSAIVLKSLEPLESKTFTGRELIGVPNAANVTHWIADVTHLFPQR